MTSAAGKRVAVLAYHKIGEPPAGEYPTWNYVPEATFLEQLALLAERQWTVLAFDELRRGLAAPGLLSERSAVLTFDDGYRSMHSTVLPLLERFDLPAVLFVPTSYVGGENSFDAWVEPCEAICDWPELVDLERRKVSIQSHGVSHRQFSELSNPEIRDEIARSKDALEAAIGHSVSGIAYPYGDPGNDSAALDAMLAEAEYEIGFLYKGGVLSLPVADRFRLTRVAMGPDSDLATLLEEE
jgi:peptidoglycan/xylan/chitin deacetylase (PgdA/CDA1 family)